MPRTYTPQEIALLVKQAIRDQVTQLTGVSRGGSGLVSILLDSPYRGKNTLQARASGLTMGPATCFLVDGEWVAVGGVGQELGRRVVRDVRRWSRAEVPDLPAIFWNLSEDYIYELSVFSTKAVARTIARAIDFESPFDSFHGSEPGFVRINDNDFYMPNYSSVDRYRISDHVVESVVGSRSPSSDISYTYSSCGMSGHAFFALEASELIATPEGLTKDRYILRLNSDGSRERSPRIADLDLWSIAATSQDRVYYVGEYGVFGYYDFATNQEVNLFSVLDFNLKDTIYGDVIDGYLVTEITYAFVDPETQTCYVVGLIEDPQIPGIPTSYNATNLVVVGDASELTYFNEPQKIITGNFSPFTMPGDQILCPDSAERVLVSRVVDENTIYGYRNFYWEGANGGEVTSIGRRHSRTAIWKVQGDSVSLFFRFPGVDNRQEVSGYRRFYNLPCRGGIYDPKTQAIYMIGFRDSVVEDGRFLGFLDAPSDKPLVRIKNGQMQPIAINRGPGVPEDFNQTWFWFGQLEAL